MEVSLGLGDLCVSWSMHRRGGVHAGECMSISRHLGDMQDDTWLCRKPLERVPCLDDVES